MSRLKTLLSHVIMDVGTRRSLCDDARSQVQVCLRTAARNTPGKSAKHVQTELTFDFGELQAHEVTASLAKIRGSNKAFGVETL